jgi:hypothetical protein
MNAKRTQKRVDLACKRLRAYEELWGTSLHRSLKGLLQYRWWETGKGKSKLRTLLTDEQLKSLEAALMAHQRRTQKALAKLPLFDKVQSLLGIAAGYEFHVRED